MKTTAAEKPTYLVEYTAILPDRPDSADSVKLFDLPTLPNGWVWETDIAHIGYIPSMTGDACTQSQPSVSVHVKAIAKRTSQTATST